MSVEGERDRSNGPKAQPWKARGKTRRFLIGAFVVGSALALWAGSVYQGVRQSKLRAGLAAFEAEMNDGLVATAEDRLFGLDRDYPNNGEVLYQIGRFEQARGEIDKAFAAWLRVPAESSSFGQATIALARLGVNNGRYLKTELALLEALPKIQDRQEHSEALRALFRLYRFEGRIADLRRGLRESFADSSDQPGLLKELWFLDASPQPAEAWRASLDKADPNDPRVQLGQANLAILTAHWAEADRRLKLCEKAEPNDQAVARGRLAFAIANDDEPSARTAAGKLSASLLTDAEILKIRAWLYRLKGDAKAERAALSRWLDIDRGAFQALERLSELDFDAGDQASFKRLHERRVALDHAKDDMRRLMTNEARLQDHAAELAGLCKTLGRDFDAWAWQHLGQGNGSIPPADLIHKSTSKNVDLAASLADVPSSATNSGARQNGSSLAGISVAVPKFEDVAESAGLKFTFENGRTSLHQLPETMSGGVALIDYDRDGRLDVYVPQGGEIVPDSSKIPNADKLFKNLGDGHFQDVSESAGISGFTRDYGLGVTVGDYDNDGFPDIFVTRLMSYALYRNQGNGTFKDVTEIAGLAGRRDNPTSAAFADFDNDGDLDLYVCHYMKWDFNDPRLCKSDRGEYSYCDPSKVDAAPDRVFRNDSGKYVDVTAEAGFTDPDGRGLAVAAADLDGDGRVEIYVANDGTANFLFQNNGGFKFEEIGQLAGVAAGPDGGYLASMGIACGDQDGDGLLDLAVTNFYGESSTLYQNLGKNLFRDRTADSGLGAATRYLLGFGTYFADVNNDGTLDLITANGHVNDNRPFSLYAMPTQLLLGTPKGKFRDPGIEAGEVWKTPRLGRGLAVGDLNNDGKLDALIISQNEPMAYLQNVSEPKAMGHFITLVLEGTSSNHDGVGATLTITTGQRRQVAQRFGGGSYQSACDPRIHFGLGEASKVDRIEVSWPSGKVDQWSNLEADTGYLLKEAASGQGTPPKLLGFKTL